MKNWIWWQKYTPYQWTDESGHINSNHKVEKPKRKIFQGRNSFKRDWDKPKFNATQKIGF